MTETKELTKKKKKNVYKNDTTLTKFDENGVSEYALNRAGVAGRPRLWKNVKELRDRIEEYRQHCLEKNEPYTMAMLAVFLDCDRRTLTEYAHRDEFYPAIKRARQMVEASTAVGLLVSPRTVGHIFSLKNNFGWVDKHELEMSGQVGINILVAELEAKVSDISTIEGEIEDDEVPLLEE